jgi:hypothetical protein
MLQDEFANASADAAEKGVRCRSSAASKASRKQRGDRSFVGTLGFRTGYVAPVQRAARAVSAAPTIKMVLS